MLQWPAQETGALAAEGTVAAVRAAVGPGHERGADVAMLPKPTLRLGKVLQFGVECVSQLSQLDSRRLCCAVAMLDPSK